MRGAIDPNDTLVRLLRGAAYSASPGRVAGIQAASPTSRVAAAAAASARPQAGTPAPPQPALDEAPAFVLGFHAADVALIVRAMIGAAAADGAIDAAENRRILGWLRDAGGTPADFTYMREQMLHPAPAEDLAGGVRSRETATEIYAAALLATEAATPGSRAFLRQLVVALGLDPEFIAGLHASWGDPPP